jgi:predicted TIM-barrel fold metal-dependent hydrolase
MATNTERPLVIALEEHYTYQGVMDAAAAQGIAARPGLVGERLKDLGEKRLEAMDQAGIDVQVISHAPSILQQLNAETSVELAMGANNALREAIDRYPDRFAGFAAVPTPDPQAAADELERAVTELGFKGAMIHGNTQGVFHDKEHFWPIYERAEALDVPIYLHPGPPHPAVVEAYYGDYLQEFPTLASAAWGYTIDTANQAMRLILSGMFERFPNLKVIVGHLGEGLPFLLDRIDEALTRPGNDRLAFKKTFCEHFYVTTSGFFSTPALLCTILQMGIDRVMFSVDWPFVENGPGMQWMDTVPLSEEDRRKMFSLNAQRLLKM